LQLTALVVALAVWERAGAIRFDWTDAEVQCAKTVGVYLRADVEPGSSGYVRHLAWISDLIVSGTVAEIRYDARGAYHTQVRINVLSVKKGRKPFRLLTVALISGPVYGPRLDRVVEGKLVNEPSFALGETVLLFLTKGHLESDSDDGPSYELPENFYCLVNQSKFHLSGGIATLEGWGRGDYDVALSDAEIQEVVSTQAFDCTK
jgi:hypothetical protein